MNGSGDTGTPALPSFSKSQYLLGKSWNSSSSVAICCGVGCEGSKMQHLGGNCCYMSEVCRAAGGVSIDTVRIGLVREL